MRERWLNRNKETQRGGKKTNNQRQNFIVTLDFTTPIICTHSHAHTNMLWLRLLKLAIYLANLGLMIIEVMSMSVTSQEPLYIPCLPPSLCSMMGPGGKEDSVTCCLPEWNWRRGRNTAGSSQRRKEIKKRNTATFSSRPVSSNSWAERVGTRRPPRHICI